MAAHQKRMSQMFEAGSSNPASFFALARLLIHASRTES
jgi:hypothetical protein